MSLTVRWTAPLLIAGLAGCECDFPSIDGGGARTRDNAEIGLLEFFSGAPEDEVCIASVRVGNIPGWSAGRYNSVTREVFLEERVDLVDDNRDWWERMAMTHEACHAADHQLGIDVEAGATWTFESDHYGANAIAREAFAFTCQFGAETIQLVGESCPDDTPGAEAFPFVLEQVYTHPVPGVVALDMQWEPVATLSLPGASEVGFEVTGTVDDTLRVALLDGSSIRYVSLNTGQPGALSPQHDTQGEAPVRLGTQGMLWVDAWASTGEAEIMTVEVEAINGGVARRLLYRDAEGIGRLGCPRPQETVFAADGRVWSAYADGDDVEWGVWQAD